MTDTRLDRWRELAEQCRRRGETAEAILWMREVVMMQRPEVGRFEKKEGSKQ